MLRACLIGLGVLLLAAAAATFASGGAVAAAIWLGVAGLMLTAGIVYERKHYKPIDDAPAGPGWIATDERFIDPESGVLVTVYFHQATGQRKYLRGQSR